VNCVVSDLKTVALQYWSGPFILWLWILTWRLKLARRWNGFVRRLEISLPTILKTCRKIHVHSLVTAADVKQ